jgi:hypothetical protein
VKWLANELAVLAGEMAQIDFEVNRLRERRAQVESTHAELAKVAALMDVARLPDLVPPVRAHRKYGGRGKLREFLREALKANHPAALDTLTLAEMATKHFWNTFDSDQQREHFRTETVTHTLRKLVHRGEVERIHGVDVNTVGAWRWRAGAVSLDELQMAVAARG